VLFGLALVNKQREVDVQLLIEDAHEKAAHYKQEGTPRSNHDSNFLCWLLSVACSPPTTHSRQDGEHHVHDWPLRR
jgi:hypothetical protein